MRSVEDEVSLCLGNFTRLCVAEAVKNEETLDRATIRVARQLHESFPAGIEPDLRSHFENTLGRLVELVSALAARLTPQMLRGYCEQSSQSQVAATLERSLSMRLQRGGAPSPAPRARP